MASKVVQISLSENEYDYVSEKAANEGLTIPLFIKSVVLSYTEFSKRFNELKRRVQDVPANNKFSIKSVFGSEWFNISTGTRLALGRAFYKQVGNGSVSNVTILDKDSANTQWYQKK